MSHELVVVVGGDDDALFDLLMYEDEDVDEEDESGEEDEEDEERGRPSFDWYVLGGRWSGFFRLRPGASGRLGKRGSGDDRSDDDPVFAGRADSTTLGDIDVEGMRADAVQAAGEHWDRWHRAVDGLPADRTFREIAAQVEAAAAARPPARSGLLRRPAPPPTAAELRPESLRLFRAQPRQAALRAVLEPGRVVLVDAASPDDLSRDEYVEFARLAALTGAHVLRDGVWQERPYIGLAGPRAALAWLSEHGRWPDEVPPDTVVAAVDIHR